MPCYIDTIVKIIQVCQSDNLTRVWEIGIYPVECEDCELEMVLFVPINDHERDPNSQSVFVTNEYYSMTVATSTHLTIRRDSGSNSIVKDNIGQYDSFTVKIVFPYRNNRFKHLMNSIQLDESVLFVVGQKEVIQGDLYSYAVETSFINVYSADKKKLHVLKLHQ
ncbi:8881_t:CDS:2, partial [Racocetra persica]